MTGSRKEVGDAGERYALQLLLARGYRARLLRRNHHRVDIEVEAIRHFCISVKTSSTPNEVSVGRETTIANLADSDFMFAFLPFEKRDNLEMSAATHQLMILPAAMVREDVALINRVYRSTPKRDGTPKSTSGPSRVKFTKLSGAHPEVCARWLTYRDRWDILPPPK